MMLELWILCGYFTLLTLFVHFSYRKQRSDVEFVLGNRSLSFWLTALSAHASDMSGWLFLGYPALIFGKGVFAAWSGIGLILGMYFNWHFVAPRLRRLTEDLGSLTVSSYFERRFQDASGRLRGISCLISIGFFTCYISSGLSAIGVLAESLLGISSSLGIVLGLVLIVCYVLSGGYRTVAWLDLFQGFFLLGVMLSIPFCLLVRFGGIQPVLHEISLQHLSTSLLPDWSLFTVAQIVMIAAGWGLGYFGQPQILTKFMGIRSPQEMRKAQYVGMSWQTLALGAATLIGLIGIFLFPQGLSDPQQVILEIVKTTLPAFVSGLVLCAIVAATINVMAAHLLIVASNLSEDVYKRFFHKDASPQELLRVSKWAVVLTASIALSLAWLQLSSVYQVVLYAWSGLGAAFGPLILFSLYRKDLSASGAFLGILCGGGLAALWPCIDPLLSWNVPPIIPAFVLSSAVLYIFPRKRSSVEAVEENAVSK